MWNQPLLTAVKRGVDVAIGIGSGVAVREPIGVVIGSGVTVAVGSGIGVREPIGVVVGPGVAVAVAVGLGSNVDVGVGCDCSATDSGVTTGVGESKHAANSERADARHTAPRQQTRL